MGNYVTVAEVRAEGVPSTYTDSIIELRISKWEAIVERYTRNVFREVDPGELIFEGTGTRYLHFGIPLIEVTEIKINDETTVLATDEYRAFTGKAQPQDDRKNPKIELTGYRLNSLWTRTHRFFYAGLNQKITATWGFVEADGSTPIPIKGAITALVARDLNGYFDQFVNGNVSPTSTSIKRERTDDHEIEYGGTIDIAPSMIPVEIREILNMYRAPMAMAVIDPFLTSTPFSADLFYDY